MPIGGEAGGMRKLDLGYSGCDVRREKDGGGNAGDAGASGGEDTVLVETGGGRNEGSVGICTV